MRAWGEPAERIEAAALIVTELVTNAVQHTTTRKIRCRLLRSADGVRICVWNRGRARIPSPASPGDSAGHPGARVPAPDGPDDPDIHLPHAEERPGRR
ncbi:ATP-binding protein, partial [Streptomyces anulatus]